MGGAPCLVCGHARVMAVLSHMAMYPTFELQWADKANASCASMASCLCGCTLFFLPRVLPLLGHCTIATNVGDCTIATNAPRALYHRNHCTIVVLFCNLIMWHQWGMVPPSEVAGASLSQSDTTCI